MIENPDASWIAIDSCDINECECGVKWPLMETDRSRNSRFALLLQSDLALGRSIDVFDFYETLYTVSVSALVQAWRTFDKIMFFGDVDQGWVRTEARAVGSVWH